MEEQNKIYATMVLLGLVTLSGLVMDFQQNDAILKTKDVLTDLNNRDSEILGVISNQADIDLGLIELIKMLDTRKQNKPVPSEMFRVSASSNKLVNAGVFGTTNNSGKLSISAESSSVGILSFSFTPVTISKEYCELSNESDLNWSFKCYSQPIKEEIK